MKPILKVDEKSQKMNKDEAATEDANQPKPATVQKERSNDVRMELEKSDRDRDSGSGNMVGKRHQPQQSNSDKPSMFNFYPLLSMCVYLSTWVVYARFFFFLSCSSIQLCAFANLSSRLVRRPSSYGVRLE